MSIIIVLASLSGAALGQFFKVMILFPAAALSILFVLAASAYGDDGPAWIALKIVVLLTGLTVGFVLGQTVFHIPDVLRRLRTRRIHSASRTSSLYR